MHQNSTTCLNMDQSLVSVPYRQYRQMHQHSTDIWTWTSY